MSIIYVAQWIAPRIVALALDLCAYALIATLAGYIQARVFDHYGDPTPSMYGFCSFNVFRHADPIGLILFLVSGIGWHRSVPTSPHAFTHMPLWQHLLISCAGAFFDFCMAVGSLIATLYFFGQNGLVGFICAATRTNVHHISFLAQHSSVSSFFLIVGLFFVVVASVATMFCVIDLISAFIRVAIDRGYGPVHADSAGSMLYIFALIILASLASFNVQCTLVSYMLFIAQHAALLLGIPL